MLNYDQAVALAPTIKGRLLQSLDALEREAFDVLLANGAAEAEAAYPDSPTSTDERVALYLSPNNPQNTETARDEIKAAMSALDNQDGLYTDVLDRLQRALDALSTSRRKAESRSGRH